ncbi:peptidase S8 and S53 subtilisin kexin sedolisin [Oscillochloris trichoides DG-6]|uniref:Peptidase S8 and S53 subtilisin kexin sedolisin n=1 Tax=Oscillochloris trichoides DG-6 TaxID=765420 RepID=E1IFV2_9CHLR|nr:peptidase S8 and S53 subtilisin kexin sedolisin [Oscillochloris trichoides DG-6]
MLALVLLFALLAVATPQTMQAGEPSVVAGEVLVRLRPGIQVALHTQHVELLGTSNLSLLNRELRMIDAYAFSPIGIGSDTYRITFRQPISPAAVATRLARDPGVVYAEPNHRRELLRTPNDTVLAQQWALNNIQAFDAWDISTGSAIVIAVLDTGVDANHIDLQGQVISGFNAFTGGNDTNDDNGHGTAVAGLIAANTNNGEGVAGICWGCKILPIKVLDSQGGGDDASVAAGIRWAVDNGARVINMSLGGSDESQTLRDAVDYAAARGVLMVAASGNERSEGNATSYPAAYDSVIAVGATGNTDVVTGFSNTGPYVDLAAPGVGLWTTLPGNQYGTPNGTSFASPYVAGAAGLAFSVRPDLPIADIRCILEAGAEDKGTPGRDDEYGWGRLNLLRSLQLAQTYTGCPLNPPAPAPNPTPAPPPPAGNTPPAFAPIPPESVGADRLYFPETQHSLGGGFRQYWEMNGGLSIFGFPISEEFTELGGDGQNYTVQYFERHRFEFHPELAPPYNVLLSRIGDDTLRTAGRDWFTFAKSGQVVGCLYFAETDQSICEPFLSYWRSNGLEFDGRASKSFAESLALFGLPLSGPQVEEVEPGVFVTVQWFERTRFEDHGGRVLLGLLGNQLVVTRGWR